MPDDYLYDEFDEDDYDTWEDYENEDTWDDWATPDGMRGTDSAIPGPLARFG